MVTDYLSDYCPPYVQTEDTTVVPFKYYFRKDGDKYTRIAKPVATSNPKTSGWYEESQNHNAEFQMNVEGHQMNRINFICSLMSKKMGEFPRVTLHRKIGAFDWSGNFFDTVWDEVVGSCPAEVSMDFNAHKYLISNIPSLVEELVKNCGQVSDDIRSVMNGIVSTCVSAPVNKTYKDLMFKFNVGTLGDSSREADTYTIACTWSGIDFRQYLYVLQESHAKSKHDGKMSDADLIDRVIDIFTTAARDIVKLARHINGIELIDATNLKGHEVG